MKKGILAIIMSVLMLATVFSALSVSAVRCTENEEYNYMGLRDPISEVNGKVIYRKDNTPIEGATFELKMVGPNWPNEKTYSAETNEEGNFTIYNVTRGHYIISITAEGYETYSGAMGFYNVKDPYTFLVPFWLKKPGDRISKPAIHSLFQTFLEQHPRMFPLLRQLLLNP